MKNNTALDDDTPVVAPYPRFRRGGPFVFVSGTGQSGPRLDGGGIVAQTHACVESIRRSLEDAGGSLENIVELTCYLADMADFPGYNNAYSQHFSSNGPARTTVAVEKLSGEDTLIEMRATAYIALGSSPETLTLKEGSDGKR